PWAAGTGRALRPGQGRAVRPGGRLPGAGAAPGRGRADVNEPLLTPQEARRQAQQIVEGLRQAGVEWLPTARDRPPRPEPPAPPAAAPESLFDDPAPSPEPAGTVLSLEQRRAELRVLAERVAGCTRCAELAVTRTQTVFADGEPGVELCFVG